MILKLAKRHYFLFFILSGLVLFLVLAGGVFLLGVFRKPFLRQDVADHRYRKQPYLGGRSRYPRYIDGYYPSYDNYYPPSDIPYPSSYGKRVSVDINLSLKVKSIQDSVDKIEEIVEDVDGAIISKVVNHSQNKDDVYKGYSYVTFKVAQARKNYVLDQLKSLAVKVVSERENQRDITGNYENVSYKISLLENNKKRLEEIMKKAKDIDDILKIQNKIFFLQQQIDSLMNRKRNLENQSNSVSFTVYLSTDEYSLPFFPQDSWNIKTVFARAVRSFIIVGRKIVAGLIWIAVFSPFLIVALLLARLLKKKMRKK